MPSHFGPTSAELPTTGSQPLAVTANNANPCVLNYGAVRHGFADNRRVIVIGFTGAWAVVNGTYTSTVVTGFAISIPVDTTALGAATGAPTVQGVPLLTIDANAVDQWIDNEKNWKESVNGGGNILANVIVVPTAFGITGSASLSFPSIPAGGWADMTFALVGALTNTPLIPIFPATLENGLSGIMFAVSAGLIKVRLINSTEDPITPAAQNFGATANAVGIKAVSQSLAFPSIPAGGWADMTMSMAGAIVNAAVISSWPSTLENGITGAMWISGAGVVKVRLNNNTEDPVTPAVQVFGAVSF